MDLKKIEKEALKAIKKAKSADDLVRLKSDVLGKKGELGQVLRGLGTLSPDERKRVGQEVNEVKARLESAFDEATGKLAGAAQDEELAAARFDVTLPGRRPARGLPHPIRLVEEEIIRILTPLGFSVAEGPLVEHDWYNFEALNIPADHPSRDMHDTFFVAPNGAPNAAAGGPSGGAGGPGSGADHNALVNGLRVVLRTHTSNVQTRVMTKTKPPVRILAPGMVFRHDDIDPTHSPVFHQIEGLWIDERATMADLRGVLRKLAVGLFGPETRIRLRPSFFPFTEPSAEVDVSCFVCRGTGALPAGPCRLCKASGWIEILGSGMVDPAVLAAVGYDPDKVQGFAFGAGMERIAMLRWAVDDIRLFYENDLRFLAQFSGGGRL